MTFIILKIIEESNNTTWVQIKTISRGWMYMQNMKVSNKIHQNKKESNDFSVEKPKYQKSLSF